MRSPLFHHRHAVVFLAAYALALGVLWARTRSFVLVVALHGCIDALSNTNGFIETWLR
jgi:membrane protease YdiL (CAAX protease family)